MAMLRLEDADFTVGRAKFMDAAVGNSAASARIYVQVEWEGMGSPTLALLDTGADWTVVEPEVAAAIGLNADDGEPITLLSAEGKTTGALVSANLVFIAEEGDGLEISATVFVPGAGQPWPKGKTVLGYSGLLHKLRIGLDPQSNDIYFGGA